MSGKVNVTEILPKESIPPGEALKGSERYKSQKQGLSEPGGRARAESTIKNRLTRKKIYAIISL